MTNEPKAITLLEMSEMTLVSNDACLWPHLHIMAYSKARIFKVKNRVPKHDKFSRPKFTYVHNAHKLGLQKRWMSKNHHFLCMCLRILFSRENAKNERANRDSRRSKKDASCSSRKEFLSIFPPEILRGQVELWGNLEKVFCRFLRPQNRDWLSFCLLQNRQGVCL